MTIARRLLAVLSVAAAALSPARAFSQTFTGRGFVETRGVLYPQEAPDDTGRVVGDALLRAEGTAKLTSWIQFTAGFDVRGDTHDQVDRAWRVDVRDRGARRPALAMRRLTATLTRGALTVDLGKQFVRWGKTDIITPTDRFAPRDFLNIIDGGFLPVTGVRAVFQEGANTVEGAWLPWLTPSRTPLLNQRWTVLPSGGSPLTAIAAGSEPPGGSQTGVRWSHAGRGYEYALSYFRGANHIPDVNALPGATPGAVLIVKSYPDLRSYGIDAAVPTPWLTLKTEASFFRSPSSEADEYWLYVVQVERQTGEWLIVGGYAGDVVTRRQSAVVFSPERGLTRSFVARASYTIDANRNLAFEAAVRQNAAGAYAKGEYSRGTGAHWRLTVGAVLVRGHSDDFLGQYRRNSNVSVALRYSF
jgi:hypothetical protein